MNGTQRHLGQSTHWLGILCIIFLFSSCSSPTEFRWADGYLEKDYTEAGAVGEADGIPGMFDKCVAVSTTMLDNNSGYIRANGIGDSKGNWRHWSGVETFPDLNIPEGGTVVCVKIRGKTIGFKVGEGDRRSSEILHMILAERIKTMEQRYPHLSDQQIERVSKIRDAFVFIETEPLDSFIWKYRRAKDPERKIAIHEAIAGTLSEYTAGKTLSVDAKKEMLTIMTEGVNSSPDKAIASLKLKAFKESEAREILGMLAAKLQSKAPPASKSSAQ